KFLKQVIPSKQAHQNLRISAFGPSRTVEQASLFKNLPSLSVSLKPIFLGLFLCLSDRLPSSSSVIKDFFSPGPKPSTLISVEDSALTPRTAMSMEEMMALLTTPQFTNDTTTPEDARNWRQTSGEPNYITTAAVSAGGHRRNHE
ncbi:hypothetical protein BGX27_003308, partial [Mortierella sp. AM989]